jgi:methionyl aminopeptidase
MLLKLKKDYTTARGATMSINSEQDLQGMRRAGAVAAEALRAMKKMTLPDVTPAELNQRCSEVFRKHGAVSAPALFYGAPVHAFISVNADVVHGLPTKRKLQVGDVVRLDVTPFVDGYIADTATTVIVGDSSGVAKNLVACAESALCSALNVIRAHQPLNSIGQVVEKEVNRAGFRVIRQLSGHSTGRAIHEEPEVLNFYQKDSRRLHEGLVLAVEPMIAAQNPYVVQRSDGWTIGTKDRSLTAHVEHTIVVTRDKPIVLTA